MQAGHILTNIGVILVAAAVWDGLRRGQAAGAPGGGSRPKTYLLVACIFAAVSATLEICLR